MSAIEITPALLADIEAKAKATTKTDGVWKSVRKFVMDEHNEYLFATPNNELSAWAAAANPAVVLAMIAQITFLHTLLFGDMLPPDDPVFRAEELDKEVKELRDENKRLKAAQCWAIVTIETGVVDGPYATKEAAENERLAELCDDPDEPMYRVEPWKGGAE